VYPFGGILVAPLIAGYLASVLCRVQCQRKRRPSLAIVLLAILAGVFVSWFSTFQFDLFSPARWSNSGKAPMGGLLLISGIPSLFVSTIAATVIVTRHRRSFDETHPEA
jgi:biotin transporter BioY